MAILSAKNISKSFGITEIFSGIDLEIPEGSKIALVGPNGAGKTTLVKILIGQDEASGGTLQSKRGLRIGFLSQHPELASHQTLWGEMLTAFTDLCAMEKRLVELEHALADSTGTQQELLEKYGRLQHEFEDAGGYTYETRIRRVLMGLSFKEDDFQRPITQLSGGQTTRALLARLLLEAPELLVLDEPTNHLDIAAIEWLEAYLNEWQGALLIVSHDRYFMDAVVNIIWELEDGELEVYRGNYSHYLVQREERYQRLLKEYEAQQEFIQKEQDYIRRNIAGQNTTQAKGRRKRLERLMSGTDRHGRELQEQWLIQRPRRRDNALRMQLGAARTGDEVLRTRNLAIGYADADEPLFRCPDLLLLRGEVAGIIGPNGAGKSTFIKTILNYMSPLEGEFLWGAKVQLGYFAQGHEELTPENSLLDELLQVKNLPISQARSYLATYLFTGEDVFRPVKTLSGGERGRLALAKLALGGANVLLLDEPSNHLDIPAQEVLQNVLAAYEGTILLVSHDRYLIDALSSQIWSIQDNALTVFKGSYSAYVADREKKAQIAIEAARLAAKQQAQKEKEQREKSKKNGLSAAQQKKRLAALEEEIHLLENTLTELGQQLATASENGAVDEVTQLGRQYTEVEARLNAKITEWAELA